MELHAAEDCRIGSTQAVGEVQATSTRPTKLRGTTIQLIATAACARGYCGLLVERELLVGGGIGAKLSLSVEDAEQEGATTPRPKLEPALPIFCFASTPSPLATKRPLPLPLITNLPDSSSVTALTCLWHRSSSKPCFSLSSSVTAGPLDGIQ